MKLMKEIVARIVSVHSGDNDDLSKEAHQSIQVELDGIVGDRHRSWVRDTWQGDKQPYGTVRRNERQWSAVSVEELRSISAAMNLEDRITAESVGANLCIEGIPELSRLPKGSLLKFPSGAELMVEEFNPPCGDMSKKMAGLHKTKSGDTLSDTAFSKASKLTRGVVGVIEAAGVINAGDEVTVLVYETPSWLARTPD
jgi:MOSC domain-containing protein YiiM